MTEKINADASPEKRLFISLITRDISLIAAFLDLIDNSINAAVEPTSSQLLTAEDYSKLSQDESVKPTVDIFLRVQPKQVEIKDTAPGISAKMAAAHVFKFGRASGETYEGDRLSVYGIGLKRALFKLGNNITICSDHIDGGFDLKLNVAEWAKDTKSPWSFAITPRQQPNSTGTTIIVKELYDDCKHRLDDGVFLDELRDAIAKTYAYYLAKFVNIHLNDNKISGINIDIGDNYASDSFSMDDVTCSITAGIGTPQGDYFREGSSGWFVFCNGRSVISADKSPLTGWGGMALPKFQPKHRPFLGTVFFVSKNAEKLPWTTTKSSINEDSAIWQQAKQKMAAVGRTVVSFLDRRYSDEGTEVASADLRKAAGTRINAMSAAISKKKFTPPSVSQPENVKIQYTAKVYDVQRIADYLGHPSMGGAEVGRHTFNHFLRNEVGEN